MQPYRYLPGRRPLLVSIPHAGSYVPEALLARFTEAARSLPDTDWHVDRLYEFVPELDAHCLIATHSRYVIDLNRPPDDTALYEGPTTGLVPETLFDGSPVYQPGREPDATERGERLARYYAPYHERLQQVLADIRARHGYALLFDAHSIRSRVPRLFEGRLPDFNLGSNGGISADAGLQQQALAVCQGAPGYSSVLNGRFKGGYITRHYGTPTGGIHTLQLELAQSTYMDEKPPYHYQNTAAERLQGVLRALLEALLDWSPAM